LEEVNLFVIFGYAYRGVVQAEKYPYYRILVMQASGIGKKNLN